MSIDWGSERAPYRQIADHLRERILSGEFDPGQTLPSVRDLGKAYDVSPNTVSRAIQELHRLGLTSTERGRGAFVRARPPIRRMARTRTQNRRWRGFYADIQDAGLTPEVQTEVRHGPVPDDIAPVLGVEPGTEVLIRDRHMGAQGQPLQLATSYFHPSVTERIPQLAEQDTGPGGMYARMEDAGYQLRMEETVSARMPLPDEARALKLSTGVPLLTILRAVYTQDDETAEVCATRLAADRYELLYEV